MHLNGVGRGYRCAVHNNERLRELYDSLSGTAYNHLLLKRRRAKALQRMRERGMSGKVPREG